MGKVFSYEDIVCEMVPEPADFAVSHDILREAGTIAVGLGQLVTVCDYGSVSVRRPSRRSDHDTNFTMPDYSPASYAVVRSILREMKDATHGRVEVNYHALSLDTLIHARHEMDRYMGSHVTGPESTQIGLPLGHYICYSPMPAEDILKLYLKNKMRRLNTNFDEGSPAETYGTLQRLLELPIAVGRKFLHVDDDVRGNDIRQDIGADKDAIRRDALRLFEALELERVPTMLLQLDRYYTDLLDEALAGRVSGRDYEEGIASIRAQIPAAADWLDRLQVAASDYLADAARERS